MTKNLNMTNSESIGIFKNIVIFLFIIVIAYLCYYLYNEYTLKKKVDKIDKVSELVHHRATNENFNRATTEESDSNDINTVNYKMNNNLTGTTDPIMNKVTTLPKGPIVGQDNVEHFSQNQDQVLTDQRNASSFPKEQLTADELLPQDNSSLWAQVNPSGEGSLKDRNFLQSGYHIGINTVGQTLRNANLQLRSEPPCPQVKVSPWGQSTIESDVSRKPFEIGGCA